MNQKNKNILLISGIVIIILLAVFLKKDSIVKQEFNTDNINTENIQSEDQSLSNPEDEGQDKTVDSKDQEQPVISEDLEIKTKFNTAMDQAQSAQLKGDYTLALKYYNQALVYRKNDNVYAGIYTIYLNQKNWTKAIEAVDQAIKINPLNADYWNWKILVMDQGLNASYSELKKVYDTGYPQIKSEEKVNLVVKFASLSAIKGQKSEAISLWKKAIELNPTASISYQAEIDALNK